MSAVLPPASSLQVSFNRWSEQLLARRCADREKAERGIFQSYSAAGLPAPENIIWCRGPLDIARQLAKLSRITVPGASLKAELFDQIESQASIMAESFWNDLFRSSASCLRKDPAAGQISQAVTKASGRILGRPSIRATNFFLNFRGAHPIVPAAGFAEVSIGPAQFARLAIYNFLLEKGEWEPDCGRMQGLCSVAESAGWLAPFEKVCWVAEPPDLLALDARGRLHSSAGPALRYRDGLTVWAWKGVEVPQWAITNPERIEPSYLTAVRDPAVRRCLIELMTPERLIASGVARPAAMDSCGTLWVATWRHRGTVFDKWCAVEVRDGTIVNGTRKHYFIPVPDYVQSAREAVAWTYGMSESGYKGLRERT
jgi:hypothetical protein